MFPHRYDYIYAPHPQPGNPPEWQTETRHPLSDRLIEQGAFLYGVRFGAETAYVLLDIDRQSCYHPIHDPFILKRLTAALEPLGITHAIAVSSSYSGGIHIYVPFSQSQKSSAIALAVQTLIEVAGFKIAPGQLELFPDAKPYILGSRPRLYAAHRLPLQSGSYVLNQDWEPVHTTHYTFVKQWHFCASQNSVTTHTIEQVLQTYRRRAYPVSAKATKFLNDLNAEIEPGWSGHGQTNRLLGRIAMREYIFGHLLSDHAPLAGDELVRKIVQIATTLPGYSQWCRHQHEIHKRAEDWGRAVEASHYFPYGTSSQRLRPLKNTAGSLLSTLSWNEQQTKAAREKIRRAIAHMLNAGTLPATATARFSALVQFGIGGSTLYRHRDLWHPTEFQTEDQPDLNDAEFPPNPPDQLKNGAGAQSLRDYAPATKSLLELSARNPLCIKGLKDQQASQILSARNSVKSVREQPFPRASQPLHEPPAEVAYLHQKRATQRFLDRMQQYLSSGDSILMAEAQSWLPQAEQLFTKTQDDSTHHQLNKVNEADAKSTSPVYLGRITNAQELRQVFSAIAAHLDRLRWTSEQIHQCVRAQFGKGSPALLTDEELLKWLHELGHQ